MANQPKPRLQPQFQQIYMALSTSEDSVKELVEKMKEEQIALDKKV
jgi:hypothetical protein